MQSFLGLPKILKAPCPQNLLHTCDGGTWKRLTWSEFQHVSLSSSKRYFFPNCRLLRLSTELTLRGRSKARPLAFTGATLQASQGRGRLAPPSACP